MNDTQIVTYMIIASLIGFGIYRKNYTPNNYVSKPYTQSNPNSTTEPTLGKIMSPSSYITGKHQVAQIAYQVEQKLDPHESIIQVHDYSNESGSSGIKHIFDVTIFNSANTQALNKRIECVQKESSVEILSIQIISPITGSIMNQRDIIEDVSDLLLDDVEVEQDAKFVRDKYTFVKTNILPPEPEPLSKECIRQLNEDKITSHCQTKLNVYSQAMAEYKRQVHEYRTKGTFTRRRLGSAPMDETIDDHKKYPLSHPQSFGFVAHEQAPIDYSALQQVTPMKDEAFFNSIAMENSSLAIQYG